jgi:hypothetical protein
MSLLPQASGRPEPSVKAALQSTIKPVIHPEISEVHPEYAESYTGEPDEDIPEPSQEEDFLPIATTSPVYDRESVSRTSSIDHAAPEASRRLTYNTYVGTTTRDRKWIGIPPLYHHEDPYNRPHLRLAMRPRDQDLDNGGVGTRCELYDNGRWPAPRRDLQSDFESETDEDYVLDSDPAWKQMPAHLLPFVPYIEKPTDTTSASTLPGRCKHIRVETIQKWLQSCETLHGSRCYTGNPSDHEVQLVRPMYLIDVKQSCLVEAPTSGRYVALSYVWGKSDPAACTTTANLEELSKPSGLADMAVPIPRTVLDAMQLVEHLGEHFLWCDRYCIVQDDNEAKYRQLATMGKIYAGAFFTLVAAQNNDAAAGLSGSQRSMLLNSSANSKHNFAADPQRSGPTGDKIMLDQAIGLMRTKWFSRGWTFQENHFSRRKLVFQDDTVNWECCNASWHEAQDMSVVLNQSHGAIKGHTEIPASMPLNSFDRPTWPDMLRYARLVSLFNERDLTFPEDIFDAFAGCLQHLSSAFPGGFVSGLPVLCFDAALLWQPWTPFSRRQSKKTDYDAILPSWSWGGWDGILQSEAWRSAANYQYVNDATQQCSWKTISTVQWYYSENATSERLPINVPPETAQPILAQSSAVELPPGWSSAPAANDKDVTVFHHSSNPSQAFRYPIPICDPQGPLQPVINARYLHCTTNRAYLKPGKPLPRWASNCTAISLKTSFGRWAGVLRLPCRDYEVDRFLFGAKDRVELIEISAGSVLDQKVEERSFDEWNAPKCPRHKGVYEFVNVLWIEWEGGVAYRKALGRVKKSAWGRLRKERVEITLG